MVLARCSPAYVAWMIENTCGTSKAADAPCAILASTSTVSVGATPQISDVTVNAARPQESTRRRPNASPSRPPTTSSMANATP